VYSAASDVNRSGDRARDACRVARPSGVSRSTPRPQRSGDDGVAHAVAADAHEPQRARRPGRGRQSHPRFRSAGPASRSPARPQPRKRRLFLAQDQRRPGPERRRRRRPCTRKSASRPPSSGNQTRKSAWEAGPGGGAGLRPDLRRFVRVEPAGIRGKVRRIAAGSPAPTIAASVPIASQVLRLLSRGVARRGQRHPRSAASPDPRPGPARCQAAHLALDLDRLTVSRGR